MSRIGASSLREDRACGPSDLSRCASQPEALVPLREATITSGMFSSGPDDWATPDSFFQMLDREFHFTLDPCCYPHTAKCQRFYTKAANGLAQEWTGAVFMNPPYGRAIGKWVRKAYESAQTTADVVVALIPSRTCSRYWHDYCMKAAEIRFVKGRLKFENQKPGKKDNAPFPNAVIVFRRGDHVPQISTIARPAVSKRLPAPSKQIDLFVEAA